MTGEVTPKHSQFIACRQGRGAGLGAGGCRRAAEGSEEAAGDKDGTISLSSYHRTLLPKATFTWRNPCLHRTEKSLCTEGQAGLPGTPQPRRPHRSAPPSSAVGPALGASESPTSVGVGGGRSPAQGRWTRGLRRKLRSQNRVWGGMSGRPAPHDRDGVWLFGQLTLARGWGVGRGTVAEDLYKNKGGRGQK